jgi:Lower baseplate protein N-terminal domain
MRKARRSTERLSYWTQSGSRVLKRREHKMPSAFAADDSCTKTIMRAVCWSRFLVPLLAALMALAPSSLHAQGPALTTISDTVYRADGSAAAGTVLISWPSFQTAEGDAVAAGNLSVAIGPLGAFTAQLVPNVGASPAGTYYVVVLQLDDGTVRTEYWAVPATSPTTISGVLTTPGTGMGNLEVTQGYVNSEVANRAVDSTVVHLAGTETITGTKQFATPPSLPTPAAATDAANKGYVDSAVSTVGSGAYVSIAGGTMTGPLTLPSDPVAPYQAADRNYVDNGLLAKANLVNGTVPSAELGVGVASSSTCLTGNSTWSTCGGGAPAGITYASTALSWTQTISSTLTGGSRATVTLSPCPVGIDTTSGAGYQVLLAGGGNSEAVNVAASAGGCTSGAASGTIVFTPFYSYPSGYTVGSASSGIQETLNAGCGNSATAWQNGRCNVTVPANGPNGTINTYNVYGTIYLHGNQSILNGYGTALNCLGRGACLQIGDLTNSNDYTNNTVVGLGFRTPVNVSSNPAFAGVPIVQTQRASQVVTVTTASAHGFRVGDMVTTLFTDNAAYWGDAIITAVPSSTTFQYAHTGADIASQATPGVVALAYVAVLDNALNTDFIDISYDKGGELGQFNNFFDLWDDENVTIDHFNNEAQSLNNSANWTGSFVFSAGNQSIQLAPVITLRDSTITANYSNGVTDYNSNGLYIENTVLQATGPWQVYSANSTGNYQGAFLKNVYSESSNAANPLSPVRSPFPGLGVAGLIAGESSGAATFRIAGTGGVEGAFAVGGAGSTPYSYFIVANDTTTGTQTSPMQVLNWLSSGSDSIPVRWPRVANGTDVITYDVIRMTTPVGVGAIYPYNGGCPGGSGGTCGYVAKGISQVTACAGGLVCTYTDSGSSSTSAYTVKTGNYGGTLAFWPGGVVTVNKSISVDAEQANSVGVGLSGNPLQVATLCTGYGASSAGGYTTCLASMTAPNNSVPNQTATIITDGDAFGTNMALTKGRLNFSSTPGAYLNAHHIITLIDSQPGLTQSTAGYRPPASPNDTWIGTDLPGGGVSAGQLAFGAPVSITNYIAQTGDGIHANWLERLNGSLKEFNVPVKFDQNVTIAGLSNGCLNVVSGVIASTGVSCGSGGGGSVSSIFGRSGVVIAASGDYAVSQVTGAAADAAVVHNTGAETIGGAKTFTSNLTVSSNLLLPQGNGFVPAVGGIGFDTAAGLPVVNIAGTTQQVALTSSNISGQAGTALALAATPTQCSGAFATGIAANGNANCTTPDVIQLSETTAPAGIPGWGVFWFDSGTHTPQIIENNGQAFQLGLTNLFNRDQGSPSTNTLEELNAANPQNLRVYSSYTSGTAWTRMSLGSETLNGTSYNVLRSEDATSGNALSLGMHIGSAIKWFFSSDGTFKPNSDNSYDAGTDSGQAMRSIFAKTSFNMYNSGRQDFEFANDAINGTTLNQLAVYNSSATGVQTASTSTTDGVVGIVSGAAGTINKAVVTWAGFAACSFDAASPVAGDYVIASTTQAGKCHDTGSTIRPTGAQVIGRIEAGGVRVSLAAPSGGSGGGAVASVFGRTGAVTATAGDYSVSQVTGAATDSAVVHLAGAETITGAKTFSSAVTVNGNLNVSGTINQTGSGPTQWSGQEWTGTTVTVPSGMAFSLGVGSDNTFHCQLTSGASCMPASGGSGNVSASGTLSNNAIVIGQGSESAATISADTTTTHALFATAGAPAFRAITASDLPTLNQSTTGTASNLSGTPTLPAGTTLPGYAATGTLITGNYPKASAAGAIVDSGVVAGPYSTEWITSARAGTATVFDTTGTKIKLWGITLTFPLNTSTLSYNVSGADSSSSVYDLGIYNGSGTLKAHTGAIVATTSMVAGAHSVAWSGSTPITLQPGKYYLAIATNCTTSCATLSGDGSAAAVTFLSAGTVTTSGTQGTLDTTITPPADSYTWSGSMMAFIVR